jgi:purine-nucleoside phosphorylase
MTELLEYFGINTEDIRKNCIICQNSDQNLFSKLGQSKTYNGFFAKINNYDKVTVISIKNNFLVGDIVLYLKETKCENVILFGSCGGCEDVLIGEHVVVKKVFNFESFSEMLEMKRNPDSYYPSTPLLNDYLSKTKSVDIKQVKCVTTNSIVLETKYKDWFQKNKINVVDMECSSVFSAASSINKKAIAIFYVTDIVGEKEPFDNKLETAEKTRIAKARKDIAASIINFIKDEQQELLY